MSVELSRSEKTNLWGLLKDHGLRIDGRGYFETRSATVQTDILPSAAGSARILVRGGNDVLASANAELRQADVPVAADRTLTKGTVAFSVEFCGVASPEFRGRGNEVVEVELASFLESMYETSADFLMGLVAGERTLDTNPGLLRVCCWDIYVDVLILGASGGNIVDATAFAIRAALATTLLPSVIWQENANGGSWELDERAENCQLLDATHAPLCSSVALLPTAMSGTRTRKDIPEFVAPELLVLDPCAEEETLAGCKISIAGTKNQHICALWKSGDLPVAPDVLLTATRLCQRECAIACLEMDQYLNDMIEAEPENDAD